MNNAQVKQNTEKLGEMRSVEDFLEDVAYQKMKKLLNETVGLDFNGYREEYLKRRLTILSLVLPGMDGIIC